MELAPSIEQQCSWQAHATFTRLWNGRGATPVSNRPERLSRTTQQRLAQATPIYEVQEPVLAASPCGVAHEASAPNVLYLAYGSNLSAETFLGKRGIRPLSAINVSAPSLRLTFNLAGFPYKEPCFANTALRKIPKTPPKLPDPPPYPNPPDYRPPPYYTNGSKCLGQNQTANITARGDPIWDKGLVGVVYEVTPEDYAVIIRTEGGGMPGSYQDILVPCFALPPNLGVPESPHPGIPRPFLAHTLFAPELRKPEGDDNDDQAKDPVEKLRRWWRSLLLEPLRGDSEYAQASARYLKLITDGAREHDLPAEYQEWLAKLQPYLITSMRQMIGQYALMLCAAPIVFVLFSLGKLLADKNGRAPVWLGLILVTFFHLTWKIYDGLLKTIFGDGERTEEADDDWPPDVQHLDKQTLLRLDEKQNYS